MSGGVIAILVLLAVAVAGSCSDRLATDPSAEAGQPLPGLSEAELGRFLLGRAVFERLVTPDEGLGPLFNADRCSACHDLPATGGSGTLLVTKATRWEEGVCDLLEDEGGDNIQQRVTPLLAARGITSESIPSRATAHVRMTSPPLFGLGLVEAIPEDILTARAASAQPYDVHGRAGRDRNGAVGRFGRKSEIATLLDFVDTALRFEIGLTTPLHPYEESINGRPLPVGVDLMAEPEIDQRGMDLLTDYIRFLAPPARERLTGAAADSAERGGRLFDQVGCTSCHAPSLRSGRSHSAALDRKRVPLYSDLLLHDLGPSMATVCGPNAAPSEWRTAPLWGLRFRTSYMHDGRATTPHAAILLHGGEAQPVRDAFMALDADERALLLRFLSSL